MARRDDFERALSQSLQDGRHTTAHRASGVRVHHKVLQNLSLFACAGSYVASVMSQDSFSTTGCIGWGMAHISLVPSSFRTVEALHVSRPNITHIPSVPSTGLLRA